MRIAAVVVGVALVSSGSGTWAAGPVETAALSEQRVTMVETTKKGEAARSFAAGTLIAAPLSRLCAVLQDYEAYPAFMPNTTATRVSQQGAGFSVIDVTLGLPMGKVKKYRLRMEPKVSAEACRLTWKLVPWPGLEPEETIADTTGHWDLASAGGKTTVKYVVTTDPGPIPFGLGWIVDSLSKDSIPKTLEALRKRAASR